MKGNESKEEMIKKRTIMINDVKRKKWSRK